jgi:hypothetical protein
MAGRGSGGTWSDFRITFSGSRSSPSSGKGFGSDNARFLTVSYTYPQNLVFEAYY